METKEIINTFGPMTMAIMMFIFGLLNCGLFMIAEKFGVIGWYERNRRAWMPKRCEFCLFFWLALAEFVIWSSIFAVAPVDGTVLIFDFGLAICAAVIARFFLRPTE